MNPTTLICTSDVYIRLQKNSRRKSCANVLEQFSLNDDRENTKSCYLFRDFAHPLVSNNVLDMGSGDPRNSLNFFRSQQYLLNTISDGING